MGKQISSRKKLGVLQISILPIISSKWTLFSPKFCTFKRKFFNKKHIFSTFSDNKNLEGAVPHDPRPRRHWEYTQYIRHLGWQYVTTAWILTTPGTFVNRYNQNRVPPDKNRPTQNLKTNAQIGTAKTVFATSTIIIINIMHENYYRGI